MEYEFSDESKQLIQLEHDQLNASIRRGEVIVIDNNTLLYSDGRLVTSRVFSYLFDEETQEFNRVPFSKDEYYKKHGKGLLRLGKKD